MKPCGARVMWFEDEFFTEGLASVGLSDVAAMADDYLLAVCMIMFGFVA